MFFYQALSVFLVICGIGFIRFRYNSPEASEISFGSLKIKSRSIGLSLIGIAVIILYFTFIPGKKYYLQGRVTDAKNKALKKAVLWFVPDDKKDSLNTTADNNGFFYFSKDTNTEVQGKLTVSYKKFAYSQSASLSSVNRPDLPVIIDTATMPVIRRKPLIVSTGLGDAIDRLIRKKISASLKNDSLGLIRISFSLPEGSEYFKDHHNGFAEYSGNAGVTVKMNGTSFIVGEGTHTEIPLADIGLVNNAILGATREIVKEHINEVCKHIIDQLQ